MPSTYPGGLRLQCPRRNGGQGHRNCCLSGPPHGKIPLMSTPGIPQDTSQAEILGIPQGSSQAEILALLRRQEERQHANSNVAWLLVLAAIILTVLIVIVVAGA
jgi:hypothetical protein